MLARDAVVVDGELSVSPGTLPPPVYLALYKPKGYACDGMPGSSSAAPRPLDRLFTVGRLDAQTSGLLFVTNDGAWAARVAHPSTGVLKEYRASVAERVTARHLDRLARGCEVQGRWVRPVAVRRQPERADGVEVVVGEGRHREVRELLAAAELSLKNLRRVQVGDYRLPAACRPGEVVELSAARAWRLVGGRGR
ncbi:hypothetical protein H632_c1092p1 [Helicosporidium sp. ATCC 50920]|nr:hypothetical protein H632_c1092p1 [Helicosporidium sp. ATCC 50920]|eukprot:KDD74758.1 hypothetical protein H632_c1092p1 [Helicosporidium sp. ATCC 50920]